MMKPKHKQSSLQSTSADNIFRNIGGSNKNVKKSNKVYVPIMEAPQNIPQYNEKRVNIQQPHIIELQRVNSQLKEKQEHYINKLIKLEQGLQKQHKEFMNLQDIYNELFSSYKFKQQQIAQLEMKFRESDRKKNQTGPIYPQLLLNSDNQEDVKNLKNIIIQKDGLIKNLQGQIQKQNSKVSILEKEKMKLNAEINYLKSKERMNDSKTSINSKMFEQLEQWQKIADEEKQSRIRLQYENQFFKTRNSDLQTRIKQLEIVISQKQGQILQLRQSNIVMHRQNSENRLSKSRSKSKSPQGGCGSPKKQNPYLGKMNSVIQELTSQNKQLREQNQILRSQLQIQSQQPRKSEKSYYDSKNSAYSGGIRVKQEEFFSFSRDQLPAISSLSKRQLSEQRGTVLSGGNLSKNKNDSAEQTAINQDSSHQKHNQSHHESHDFEELPVDLQVDELIKKNRQRRSDSLGSPSGQYIEEKIPSFQFA